MAKNLTVQQRINKIEEILRRETVVLRKTTCSDITYKRFRTFIGTLEGGKYTLSLQNCRYSEGKLKVKFHYPTAIGPQAKILSLIDKYIDK